MIDMKLIRDADRAEITRYLKDNPTRICESTFGVVYLWNVNGDGLYEIKDGTLYLANEREGAMCFSYPIGGEDERALDEIVNYCKKNGKRLRFRFLSEEQSKIIEGKFGVKCNTDRDWSDYIYDAEELKRLSGKKFHGQKNHLNRFLKDHPDYEFLPYSEELSEKADKFFDRYYAEVDKDDDIFRDEKRVFKRIIENFADSGQQGGVLLVDGEIVAISIGEVAGDTLYVHFEKALREYSGSYAAINYLFANRYCGDAKYINREEDVGDEGLRIAKTSLHPVMILDKFFAEVEL